MKHWHQLTLAFLLGGIFFTNFFVEASGPISHAYLSKRFFEYYPKYTHEEKKAFMIGSLFPDIRYLGTTHREETHFENVTIQEILDEKSPFLAGMKFHSYVDIVRENCVIKDKVYEQLADISTKNMTTFLKFVEDEIIYSQISNWEDCVEMLSDIAADELQWGINDSTIRKWHNLLALFFSNPPSTVVFLLNLDSIGVLEFSKEEVAYWSRVLKPVAQNPKMQRYVKELLNHFETQLAVHSNQVQDHDEVPEFFCRRIRNISLSALNEPVASLKN